MLCLVTSLSTFISFSHPLYYHYYAPVKAPSLSPLQISCLPEISHLRADSGVTTIKYSSTPATLWLNNLQTPLYFAEQGANPLADLSLFFQSALLPHAHMHFSSCRVVTNFSKCTLSLHAFAQGVPSSWNTFPFSVHLVKSWQHNVVERDQTLDLATLVDLSTLLLNVMWLWFFHLQNDLKILPSWVLMVINKIIYIKKSTCIQQQVLHN